MNNLIELRQVAKEKMSLAKYIYRLQYEGKLRRYVSKDGYVSYNADEYATYKKSQKLGRPIKK